MAALFSSQEHGLGSPQGQQPFSEKTRPGCLCLLLRHIQRFRFAARQAPKRMAVFLSLLALSEQVRQCDVHICSLNTIQKQAGLIHRTLITAKRPLLDKFAPLDVSRQGTDPAHPARALTPGDDPFALSAAPMLCFIKTSFCKVPWPRLQQWQPLFTSAPPSEHRLKAPEHHPEGR